MFYKNVIFMHEMAILKVDELQVWEDLPAHGRADDHLPQVGRGHRLRLPAGQRVRTQVKVYFISIIRYTYRHVEFVRS